MRRVAGVRSRKSCGLKNRRKAKDFCVANIIDFQIHHMTYSALYTLYTLFEVKLRIGNRSDANTYSWYTFWLFTPIHLKYRWWDSVCIPRIENAFPLENYVQYHTHTALYTYTGTQLQRWYESYFSTCNRRSCGSCIIY